MADVVRDIHAMTAAGLVVTCRLEWDAADPLVARLGFSNVTWEVARDLLKAGLSAAVGAGDVRVAPWEGDLAQVTFYPGSEQQADIAVNRHEVWSFLKQTYEIVGMGTETVPDDEFERLLD
jgi:hypothetical protein